MTWKALWRRAWHIKPQLHTYNSTLVLVALVGNTLLALVSVVLPVL